MDAWNPRHFLRLTWLEIKIFLREPLGAIGTILVPVALFVLLGQLERGSGTPSSLARDLPIVVTLLVAVGGVTSLIAIVSIYREGGILKRLRATPLAPLTILSAHVAVKLVFTALTLGLLALVGRRFYIGPPPPAVASFLAAVALVMVSVLAIGFVFASLVPTARFAQPLASMLLYPLFAVSGLFFPLDVLPGGWQTALQLSPLTHAVDLLRATWSGTGWAGQGLAVAALALNFALCTALAAKVFRWE